MNWKLKLTPMDAQMRETVRLMAEASKELLLEPPGTERRAELQALVNRLDAVRGSIMQEYIAQQPAWYRALVFAAGNVGLLLRPFVWIISSINWLAAKAAAPFKES